ncbi:hypothetical protein Ahy_A01g003612 isoform B [Arachis hypogaea]|nr:hypothetical protein Ahy_A01g003612 isoform B [Arachis hypogaea]
MEVLEPFEGWSQGSFQVRLSSGLCDYGLFHALHYPCCPTLAACASASIEWTSYVHPVYRSEAMFKVFEMEFPPIQDKSVWPEWYGTLLRPNPLMRKKATGRPVSTRFQNDMDKVQR